MSSIFDTNTSSGTASQKEGQNVGTFLSSLAAGIVAFVVQLLLFYILKNKFTSIYRPKTYLVPEKDRTKPPPPGIFRWIIPVFKTSNAELMAKCGLDAYFFLRYLRMLLKIFVPSAIIICLTLMPINSSADNEALGVTGLDRLGWSNYNRSNPDRLWAHLLLAVGFLFWIAYVIYDELRGYIRVRQAYLTSPQHRLRASATTVLIRSVPRKWLTVEALDKLFDVFPGGVRNIWINRDFEELNTKVKLRDQLATKLEAAETSLVRNAKRKHMEMQKKEKKLEGKQEKLTRAERRRQRAKDDAVALELADQEGVSAGDPHQAHTVHETVFESEHDQGKAGHEHGDRRFPVPMIGQGYDAVRGGLGLVTGLGKKIIDDVRNAPHRLDDRVERAYEGAGFSFDGQREPLVNQEELARGRNPTPEPATAATMTDATWPSPASGDDARLSVDQGVAQPSVKDGVAQQDHATSLRATNSPDTFPVSQVRTDDTGRTATASVPEKPTTANSKKGPPGDLQFTKDGLLEVRKKGLRSWIGGHDIALPSPEPARDSNDPFGADKKSLEGYHGDIGTQPSLVQKIVALVTRRKPTDIDTQSVRETYPDAYDSTFEDDKGMGQDPEWTKYLKPNQRDTMRLPIFGWTFMPFMPSWTFIGTKVDTIYYCRKEVARLNLEIETDQREPEKFPLMNSAFIQFNNQVAAHMACQSVAHHLPATMAPRIVEIAPGDVLWDNMSIGYKSRLARTFVATVIVIGMVVLWAVPVSLTSAFQNLRNLQETWGNAFSFLNSWPDWLISALQGIIPPLLLIIIMALLPIILRALVNFQGVPTGMTVEINVQSYYFAFLFVQIFLIVTISSSIFKVFEEISQNPTAIANILATNIPRAANYFFSYLILQALSVSSGALAQVAQLAIRFIVRPIVDNTARQKFSREMNLQTVQWGTFFPVYTNLACIGLIYSIITPLVMVFNIITFSLFWVTYRYQTLYVNKYSFDTGGLLFPKAINQLLTGVYIMEISLVGLFFLVRDDTEGGISVVCLPQAIIMIIMLCFTVIFHVLLNINFSPLFRYMPITFEDEAVERDEEFARMQAKKWRVRNGEEEGSPDNEKAESKGSDDDAEEDIEDQLEAREDRESEEEHNLEAIELKDIRKRRASHGKTGFANVASKASNLLVPSSRRPTSWADNSRRRQQNKDHVGSPDPATLSEVELRARRRKSSRSRQRHSHVLPTFSTTPAEAEAGGKPGLPANSSTQKIDAQTAIGDVLFGNFSDEIEDLTAEERDTLVQRAFQHSALRARRPVIWLPRDDLGVSDDEIRRTQAFAGKNIWASNEGTGLDRKARVVFRRAPPDFSEVDLIEL